MPEIRSVEPVGDVGYYFIFMWGCVDPQLYGPFDTSYDRDKAAHDKAMSDPAEFSEGAIMALDITDGVPSIGGFAHDTFDDVDLVL